MQQNDIYIEAHPGDWLKFLERKDHKRYHEILTKIAKTSQNTCYYCGWECDKFMHLINKDRNYKNNISSNLTICCSLCMQALFIDGIGYIPGTSGLLIYLPEISQVKLNNLCRLIFCMLSKESAYKLKLQTFFISLKEKSDIIEQHFGKYASDPIYFTQGIVDSINSTNSNSNRILKGVRLLPLKACFPEETEFFCKEKFTELNL